jgi:AraC-like DNA-binding protein
MLGSAPHRLGLPTATGELTRLVARELRAAGIDLEPLLHASRLSSAQIQDSDERLGAEEQVVFVEAAAHALGRIHLGFELALGFDLRRIGLLYYVAAASETLGEAVHRIERYSAVGNEAVVFRASNASDLAIQLDYSGIARHSDRHQVEFFMIALVRLCRSLTGLSLTPARVTICHGRSEGVRDYNAFFGCETEFHAEHDSLVFEESCRGLPVVSADPHLSEILIRYCEDTLRSRLKASSSFRIRVENAIAPLLPHGKPRVSTIARKLNVSHRTLARRLAEEKASFAVVLDEMRRDLAIGYLEEPKLSISQIAWLLGFQEVAAFTHAFRRWTGKAPSAVRRSEQRGVPT